MKKLVILAGFALLAACGAKKDTAADAAASDSAAASAAATPAAVHSPAPGSYDVTNPDGKVHITTLIADGTFVQRETGGKVMDKGKWAVRDGKTCFASDKGSEECYVDSMPGADGSFTATDAKGVVVQVKPHAK